MPGAVAWRAAVINADEPTWARPQSNKCTESRHYHNVTFYICSVCIELLLRDACSSNSAYQITAATEEYQEELEKSMWRQFTGNLILFIIQNMWKVVFSSFWHVNINITIETPTWFFYCGRYFKTSMNRGECGMSGDEYSLVPCKYLELNISQGGAFISQVLLARQNLTLFGFWTSDHTNVERAHYHCATSCRTIQSKLS